ncbi:MAG: hypothetical protein J6V44_05950 [Methanobrevibacter sp.]|nr:hypothetical protein [Methanobrevibacter sp.]MBO7692794.1 hypothetical protein [Methanobrevibacter sp.]
MKIYYENIITDLRRNGINITQDMFDAINEFADIQNSFVHKLDIDKWQDVKGKTVLFVNNGEIEAVYGDGRFMYNPRKVKVSQAPEFDIYEVEVLGTNVQNRRQERRDYLKGLTKTKDSSFSNVPKSTTYIWSKDWDPEVNKIYYSKLLQRNHLGRYASQLEDAYDVVKELIDQRRERLAGKRTEYDRMITNISRQIGKIEDEMIAAERDFEFDVDKLKKEMSKLPNLVNIAREFIKTEEDEYKHWGKRKPYKYDKISK